MMEIKTFREALQKVNSFSTLEIIVYCGLAPAFIFVLVYTFTDPIFYKFYNPIPSFLILLGIMTVVFTVLGLICLITSIMTFVLIYKIREKVKNSIVQTVTKSFLNKDEVPAKVAEAISQHLNKLRNTVYDDKIQEVEVKFEREITEIKNEINQRSKNEINQKSKNQKILIEKLEQVSTELLNVKKELKELKDGRDH